MNKLVSLFIAIVLSYGLFNELRICAFPKLENGNDQAWFVFQGGGSVANEIPANWKSHELSFEMSSGWSILWGVQPSHRVDYQSQDVYRRMIWGPTEYTNCNIFASYYAVLFFIVCTALVFCVANPALPMVGAFASILMSAPGFLSPFILPWDLPTMAAWTIVFLIYSKIKLLKNAQAWLWFAVAIAFLGLIKETVLVTALFFIAAPYSWPKRISAIASIVIFSQLLNWGLLGARPDWLFSVSQGTESGGSKWNPLMLWPIVLANAGSVVLMPWLLCKKRDWPLAAVCGAFIVLQALNNLACGVYNENRDWLEIAPIGWILIAGYFTPRAAGGEPWPSCNE